MGFVAGQQAEQIPMLARRNTHHTEWNYVVGEEIQIRAREIKKCATIVPVYGSNSYYRFVSECECW